MRIKINDDGSNGAGVEGRRTPVKGKSSSPSEKSETVPLTQTETGKSKKKFYGGSLKVIEGDGQPGEADRS